MRLAGLLVSIVMLIEMIAKVFQAMLGHRKIAYGADTRSQEVLEFLRMFLPVRTKAPIDALYGPILMDDGFGDLSSHGREF